MAIVTSTACRLCGTELTDPLSRRYGIGPDCRADLTPEQLADAIRANQPGHIPKAPPPSPAARVHRANAEQARNVATCDRHGGVLGRCPQCAREADPARSAERIIADIRGMPAAERRVQQIAAARSIWAARALR
ncbi:MAG: hypothetical protein J2P26_00590 [Nocardiopsaceae bacterium]|nr:hypothetical protein [Nocardiopsaceae bacterium]